MGSARQSAYPKKKCLIFSFNLLPSYIYVPNLKYTVVILYSTISNRAELIISS